MADKLLARIKPGKKGYTVKRYMFENTLYVATRGWYEVSPATADKLRKLHQDDTDTDSPKIFQVATREEAVQIEEQEAEQQERATAARPNRVPSSSGAMTARQRERGGDLATSDLPANQKEEPMLDPDPEGEELAQQPDEQEGIAPIGRVTEDESKPRRRTVVTSPSTAATTPAMPAVVVPSKTSKK